MGFENVNVRLDWRRAGVDAAEHQDAKLQIRDCHEGVCEAASPGPEVAD